MADWHGYIGVEDVALTAQQRADVIAAFRELGPVISSQPAHLNHWRTSLDGSKVIFEALFNVDNLTVNRVKQFIADATGADPATIDDDTQQTAYGPGVTFSANSSDRMRFLVFGGLFVTWETSRLKVIEYLKNNIAEWEENEL